MMYISKTINIIDVYAACWNFFHVSLIHFTMGVDQ